MNESEEKRLSWVVQPRNLNPNGYFNPQCSLDENYQEIQDIPSCSLVLLPHQKVVLEATLSMKYSQSLPIQHPPETKLNSNVVVMSDKAGSGKSKSLVAICCIKEKLPNKPIHIAINTKDPDLKYYYNRPNICKAKFNKIIPCTLIFASKNVIDQWIKNIESMSDLNYYVVNRVNHLDELFTMMNNGRIEEFDIILVKNGTCNQKFTLPFKMQREYKLKNKTVHIYDAIVNASRQLAWDTVIIDDFDVVGLKDTCDALNALFTILVSATKNVDVTKSNKNSVPKFSNVASALKCVKAPIFELVKNKTIFELCNIRCEPNFIDSNLPVPTLKYFIHKLKNPNDKMIKSIANCNNLNNKLAVLELLNSEEYKQISEQMNQKIDSVKDLFKLVLKDSYSKWIESVKLVTFVSNIDVESLPKPPKNSEYKYNMQNVNNNELPEYNCGEVNATIKYVKDKHQPVIESTKKSIDEMLKYHIDDDCMICLENMKETKTPTIILSCCCKFIHAKCLNAVHEQKDNQNINRCMNCRQEINAYYPVPNLKGELDDINFHEQIINRGEKKEVEVKDELIEVKQVGNTPVKYSYIVKLLQNKAKMPDPVEMNFKGVLKNDEIVLPEVEMINKALIFSNHEEVLKNIETLLMSKDVNIKARRLYGQNHMIQSYKEEFRKADKMVLLINTSLKSAGMNLQTADAAIYVTYNPYENTLSQSIGRIQRYGRTTRGQVHFIIFDNEYEELKQYIKS